MKNTKKLPRIGMRIIKSAIGVFLCFAIYFLRGKQGIPFYSAIAVLWCVQNDTRNTFSKAVQRTVGTVIGALYGLIFLTGSIHFMDEQDTLWYYFLLSVMVIPVIYTAVLFHKKNAAYFSCVVFLSIVVNHVGDENPYLFVLNRTLDTMIGILLGLVINSIPVRMKKRTDTLFVADFDHILHTAGEQLNAYSRISIKNLMEDGMKLTFMTSQTPAAYLEEMSDIRPGIPMIAMGGAVLYDVKENSFRKSYIISAENARNIEEFFKERGFHVFSNVIIEDVLIIYHDDLKNEAEKKIYEKLHRSPYRNYLNQPRPDTYPVVYFMVIHEKEKIRQACEELGEAGMYERFKVISYDSDDYPGYAYVKIYNKNASMENMLSYLQEMSGMEHMEIVSDSSDLYYADDERNQIVRSLTKMYYR